MKRFKKLACCVSTTALAAGCAFTSPDGVGIQEKSLPSAASVNRFSASPPQGLPAGWSVVTLTRNKKPTDYRLTEADGRTVLHARADGAASVLMQEVGVDLSQDQWVRWRWKIARPLEQSNNFVGETEDSPARIVFAFDGDKGALPFGEQILFETGRLLSGREPAYATLMYIWERQAPIGTIIANTRTGRIKKVVAASGRTDVGQWRTLSRNIVADFEAAFGEKPGRLIGVGVMTDTDNTGESAEAWYGDIELLQKPM